MAEKKKKKSLLLLESPGKIKKIEKFLGPEFKIVASFGHVLGLDKKHKEIDEDGNVNPKYVILPDKKDVVKGLKQLVHSGNYGTVYLGMDRDMEGENIAYSLKNILEIPEDRAERISFTEISKSAVLEAIKNSGKIDMNIVQAQQARAIIDKRAGFEISPVLWKKISSGMNLSAGRVQSIATKLIIDKENEIHSFSISSDFKVTALFNFKGIEFKSTLDKQFKTNQEAKKFLEKIKDSTYKIKNIEQKSGTRSPSAPFTTSTLQQVASSKLGMSPQNCMQFAQKLYESGYSDGGAISYMRSDSVMLSEDSLKEISSEITTRYGKEYSNLTRYKTKSSSAQQAHEAIKILKPSITTAGNSNGENRLYDLIWKRTMASQMSNAKIMNTTVIIGISGAEESFITKGQIITFEGFLKAYSLDDDEDDDKDDDKGILPNFKKGDVVENNKTEAYQSFKKPPARYSEAGLIKILESKGIGRPSTYSSILLKVTQKYAELKDVEPKKRNVERITLINKAITEVSNEETYGGEKKKLIPTDIGIIVNDFLVSNFDTIMQYEFTANIEEQLDKIANGEAIWTEVINNFYIPFHEKVKEASKGDEKVGIRELGEHPDFKKPIFAKLGKFGPMVQMGEKDDEEKPKFAKLKEGQSIDTLTLEEAIALLAWPRVLGEYNKLEVTVNVGKFGPYVKYDGAFTSLGEELDVNTVTLEECTEIIKEAIKVKNNRVIKEFKSKDIFVLNGKYGAYISKGKKNFKIPEYHEAKDLTLKDCEEIIKNFKPKKKFTKKK
tara:strand:- start:5520 stop:7859 length:2340 start_codon:yes stop_codon:yes gene_type:complete